jgi:hypothetical protein
MFSLTFASAVLALLSFEHSLIRAYIGGRNILQKDALGPKCRDGEDMLGVVIEMYTSIIYKSVLKKRRDVYY